MSAALRFAGSRLRKAFVWEDEVSTIKWAEKNVYLHSNASPKPGYVDFRYTPHVKDIFDAFDRPEVSDIAIESASQNAKTLILMTVNAKIQSTEPCPVQFVTPIKDKVTTYLSEKVNPFNKGVKVYLDKMEDYKSEENIRTKDAIKKVSGGSTLYTGTTSTERKSFTIKVWIGDELGEFPEGAVVEGQERTKTYEKFFPKRIGASTIVHPNDELVNYAKTCTATAEFSYACPGCGDTFYAGSKHLKYMSQAEFQRKHGVSDLDMDFDQYKDEAGESGYIECPHCDYQINNEEKDDLIYDGKGVEFVYVKGSITATKIHFRMNSLTSWFVSLKTIIGKVIDAGEDPEKLDVAYRGWFSEFYEHKYEETEESDMLLLGNGLHEWVVPQDTYKVYIGVDTQKDHFWYEAKAYCYGNTPHSISSGRLETFGDIEDLWLYSQDLHDEDGDMFMAAKMGIDRRGYNQDGVRRTDEVDEFVAYMVAKYKNGDENRIYATEGHPALTGDKPFIISEVKDYSNNRIKTDVKVVKLSNIYLKNAVQRGVERAILKAKATSSEDDGYLYEAKLFYINQDTIDADVIGTNAKSYTRQLTAEVFDYAKNPKTGKLDAFKSWINPKKRDNHLFDTSVICEAFAEIDKINLKKQSTSTGIAASLSGLSGLSG